MGITRHFVSLSCFESVESALNCMLLSIKKLFFCFFHEADIIHKGKISADYDKTIPLKLNIAVRVVCSGSSTQPLNPK